MAIQEHLAPYLNRFVILLHQKATAKLELTCKDGKVNVNMSLEKLKKLLQASLPINLLIMKF